MSSQGLPLEMLIRVTCPTPGADTESEPAAVPGSSEHAISNEQIKRQIGLLVESFIQLRSSADFGQFAENTIHQERDIANVCLGHQQPFIVILAQRPLSCVNRKFDNNFSEVHY